MSIGNQPVIVNFDQERTLISGANGNGKSSIFIESICYALYGKSFRKLKLGQLVNSINKKKCIVTLQFEKNGINFKIIRGQKPSIFEIYKNEVLIDPPANISDYQNILDEIIGIEIETFKQIIAIGTAGYLPFMQLPSAKRRAMIEDLIGIDIFGIMGDLNKADVREKKTNLNLNINKIDTVKREFTLHKQYQADHSNNIQLQIDNLLEDINEVTKNIEENNVLIAENLDTISELNCTEQDKIDLNNSIAKLKHELISLKGDKKHTETKQKLLNDHSNCPSCDQSISDEMKAEQIPDLQSQCNNILIRAKEISVVLKSDMGKLVEVESGLLAEHTLLNINVMKRNLNDSYDIQINNNNLKINELKSNTIIADVSDQLNSLTEDLKSLAEQKIKIQNELKSHDIIKTMVGDAGVKKFIIAQYIPLLNSYINKYLDALGANYVFILDDSFNETIKSRGREIFSYESFSQGEKARIDLSIILAFRQLVACRSNSDSIMNILILDEILSGPLDENGTNDVGNLLKEINREGAKLYVISHDPTLKTSDIWTNVIELEKLGNFTQIKTI